MQLSLNDWLKKTLSLVKELWPMIEQFAAADRIKIPYDDFVDSTVVWASRGGQKQFSIRRFVAR
jgi:hypothetical protein